MVTIKNYWQPNMHSNYLKIYIELENLTYPKIMKKN
jgi:hypothetical protein